MKNLLQKRLDKHILDGILTFNTSLKVITVITYSIQ